VVNIINFSFMKFNFIQCIKYTGGYSGAQIISNMVSLTQGYNFSDAEFLGILKKILLLKFTVTILLNVFSKLFMRQS